MNPEEIKKLLYRMLSDRTLAHQHRQRLSVIVKYIDELEEAVVLLNEKIEQLETE